LTHFNKERNNTDKEFEESLVPLLTFSVYHCFRKNIGLGLG